jgi:single-stranded DNA-specific DHH superfamily exonuclease
MENKYLLGSEEDFHNFVDSISKEDKVGLVTHTDLDGIASAVFLQKILEAKSLKLDFIDFRNYSSDALKEILKKDYDKLFFTDWKVDESLKDLKDLREKGDVLVFDHHPVNDSLKDKTGIIKTDVEYCSSHALFDLSKRYFDTKSWEWLVCSSIIEDYTFMKPENFEFMKSIYSEIKKDEIWDSEPGKIGRLISNALIYYAPNFRKVYDLVLEKDLIKLEKANEEVVDETKRLIEDFGKKAEYFPEKKLYFYYAFPKYGGTSSIISKLSQQELPNETLVFVSDVKERDGFVKVSSRNQSGNVNLDEVLKKSTEGFEDVTAGGHVKASGASFPKKYLGIFKERLLKCLTF